ncbi:hypothetical protein Bhyg_12230, partial [Pseudolycoriella hygida]
LFFSNDHSLLERGENSYQSGHVKRIDFDADLKIIRGNVFASMKSKSYENEIYLNGNFQIERATCKCLRGLHICNHIAATLFAAHYDISKTDVSCSWVPAPKETSDVKTLDDTFNICHKRVTNRNLYDYELDNLIQKLSHIPPVGFRWILRSFLQPVLDGSKNTIFETIDVKRILQSEQFTLSSDKWDSFKVTKEIVNSVMTLTIGQTDLRHLRAIQWGITHETEGVHTIKKPIKPCGFFLSECGVLGASPDGIVDDDFIVEIKCPYKFRHLKLTEALRDDRSYVFYYNDMGQLSVNKMHPYYHQVQGQIYLSKRKGCYLCVWTPKGDLLFNFERY